MCRPWLARRVRNVGPKGQLRAHEVNFHHPAGVRALLQGWQRAREAQKVLCVPAVLPASEGGAACGLAGAVFFLLPNSLQDTLLGSSSEN